MFGIVALLLMIPLCSNTMAPEGEILTHMHLTMQARMALEEGQFPLRVAPVEHHGLRYPVFQFYSSLPYYVSALLYKFVFPANPYKATKAVYWLSLVLAGIFAYRLGRELQFSESSSLIMGLAYVTAPYLLLNLYVRNHLTELLAQALLPLLFLCAVRFVEGST